MNASARPPRRQRSTLAAEHVAFPSQPVAVPDQPGAGTAVGEGHGAGAIAPGPVTGSRGRRGRESGAGPGEPQARKYARDAAWGWAAAIVKADRRLGEWAEGMARARALGTLPGILRDYIREAAEQAGLTEDQVPREVWAAAGLTPP